jgi:hypothetical protein
MKEIKHEMFRAEKRGFEKNFADFIIANKQDHWKVNKCTFFSPRGKTNSWAFCSFQRSG